MPPLHVAMLIQRYAPLIGGAERQVAAVSEQLTQRGVKVSIITRRYAGLSAFEEIAGVPVYRMPIPGPKVTASLSYTVAALPLLKRLQPDVLHAHEIFSPATTAITAKRFLHIPVVLTAHRSGPIGDFARLRSKFMGNARLANFRRNVDRFIPISQEIAQEMERAGIKEAQRYPIPNGVDTQHFQPLDQNARIAKRKELGLPKTGPIAIFTGRLAPEKRIDQLVRLWASVRADTPEATLLVLGTGELAESLKQAAGEGVVFAGAKEDVAPYLQASDLFVLPSAAEGLSVAMLEAMSCGLPVLVTNIGGAPDVITHSKNGWLIPPDAPEALQAGLYTLLNDEALRMQMGQAGRQTVQQAYSLSAVAEKLHTLYLQVSKWER